MVNVFIAGSAVVLVFNVLIIILSSVMLNRVKVANESGIVNLNVV